MLLKRFCPWKNLSKVKVEIMIRGRGEATAKGASSTNLRHSLSLMLLLLLLLLIFYLCCYHSFCYFSSNLPHTASRPPLTLSPPDPLYWRQPKITKNNRKFISTSNMGGLKELLYHLCRFNKCWQRFSYMCNEFTDERILGRYVKYISLGCTNAWCANISDWSFRHLMDQD